MMDNNSPTPDVSSAGPVDQALEFLDKNIQDYERLKPLSFEEFLNTLTQNPSGVLRNVFQAFHDMIKSYVDEIDPSVAEDAESLNVTKYDCSRLFVEDSDNPYFPDMLFANRFMKQMEYLRHGAQQNRIYVFYGPHGCGKSTFLNNLLTRFEDYANTEEGLRYEVVWRLDIKKLKGTNKSAMSLSAFEKLIQVIDPENDGKHGLEGTDITFEDKDQEYIEVPCLCHDNPFLVIPKDQRRNVLDELIKNDEFKWKLFTEKQYEWVFKEEVCTICSSIYHSLLERLGSPSEVFSMLYAR
ncbi:MAG: serine protein kinase PrkA, partial [Desulfobacterales bacterium]|nr:serine protein kinase PrkA [Desulfobacterales bacterium]